MKIVFRNQTDREIASYLYERFASGDGDYAVPRARRYGRKAFHMGTSRRSYEQIKRGLEDYTACLLENSCNIPGEVNNE